jgi:hypothetical protein
MAIMQKIIYLNLVTHHLYIFTILKIMKPYPIIIPYGFIININTPTYEYL